MSEPRVAAVRAQIIMLIISTAAAVAVIPAYLNHPFPRPMPVLLPAAAAAAAAAGPAQEMPAAAAAAHPAKEDIHLTTARPRMAAIPAPSLVRALMPVAIAPRYLAGNGPSRAAWLGLIAPAVAAAAAIGAV